MVCKPMKPLKVGSFQPRTEHKRGSHRPRQQASVRNFQVGKPKHEGHRLAPFLATLGPPFFQDVYSGYLMID